MPNGTFAARSKRSLVIALTTKCMQKTLRFQEKERPLSIRYFPKQPARARDRLLVPRKIISGQSRLHDKSAYIIPKLHICQLIPKMLAARNNRSLALACSTMFMQKRLTGNSTLLQALDTYTPAAKLTSLASSYAARMLTVVTLLMSRSSHKPVLAPPDSRLKIKKSILSAQRHQHFGSAKQTSLRDCTCRKVHAKKLCRWKKGSQNILSGHRTEQNKRRIAIAFTSKFPTYLPTYLPTSMCA